jgi:hypothetical protein
MGPDVDRTEDMEATWRRIRRPLQWPAEDFRRRRVSTDGFLGYRFSRSRGRAAAGFAFGFLRRDGGLGIRADPPEAVVYAFVEPLGSALHRTLVTRRASPVRRLVRASLEAGVPFEFRPASEIAAIRHRSLRRPPSEIFVLSASDFFLSSYGPMWSSRFLEALRKATSRPGP